MRIWKNIFCGMIAFGFILAIGTAGSSDVGAIGEQELYIRLAVAAGITIVGFVGAYLIERWEFSGTKNERPRQLTTEGALSTEEKVNSKRPHTPFAQLSIAQKGEKVKCN